MVVIMKKEIHETAQKQLSDYLSEHKLRATTQREIILQAFIDNGKHVTAEDLYEVLKKKDGSIGHATVYRALRLFVSAALARELNFNDGSLRYEMIVDQGPHDHLVCTSCGEVIEFEDPAVSGIQDEVAEQYGYTLKNRSHILFGICSKCAKG
jgi:Fur family ferric uptake transcriptional regulator